MRINELLHKEFFDLTDDELRYIGNYFLKHPERLKPKPKVILHRCIDCKWCSWYDCLGNYYWECQKNPCDDLSTQSDRLLNRHKVVVRRKCDLFEKSK